MTAVKSDLLLIGLSVVALVLIFRNAEGIAGAVANGAVDAVTGAAKGIGDTVNDRLINPAVAAATGEPDATLGGKIWDWLHPQDAYYLKNGLPLYP